MKKRKYSSIIIASLVVIIIMTVVAVLINRKINSTMRDHCFNTLKSETIELGNDLKDNIKSDKQILNTIANMIVKSSAMAAEDWVSIMDTFDLSSSFVSYMEILKPDNMLLLEDGTTIDATGKLNFEEELKRGYYISEMEQGISKPDDIIIRNAVPVLKDGKPVCFLYGVISLTEMQDSYTTHIFDNHAKVFLLDGVSGNLMLDTWHKQLGNLGDFSERKMVSGYSTEQMREDCKNNKAGDIAFTSETINETIFIHYEPVGINNWMVAVMVPEKEAFKVYVETEKLFVQMAVLEGICLIVYILFIVKNQTEDYRTIKRISEEDETTGLKNRNIYEIIIRENQNKRFEKIACVYLDINGLHEVNNKFGHDVGDQMLRTVANALRESFSCEPVFRVGGDEFVVFCENMNLDECKEKAGNVARFVEKNDYYVSVGFSYRESEVGLERVIKEADQTMLENKREFYKTHNRQDYRSEN